MFMSSSTQAHRYKFVEQITDGLTQILDHKFDAEEVVAYDASMRAGCEALMRLGANRYEKMESEMRTKMVKAKTEIMTKIKEAKAKME